MWLVKYERLCLANEAKRAWNEKERMKRKEKRGIFGKATTKEYFPYFNLMYLRAKSSWTITEWCYSIEIPITPNWANNQWILSSDRLSCAKSICLNLKHRLCVLRIWRNNKNKTHRRYVRRSHAIAALTQRANNTIHIWFSPCSVNAHVHDSYECLLLLLL